MAAATWWRWRRRSGRSGSARGGPALCFLLFLTLFKSVCRELYMPLGTGVLRGFVGALGTELFAGRTVPRALCRELSLGRACAEWKPSCAESMLLSAQAANPVVVTVTTLPITASLAAGTGPWTQIDDRSPTVLHLFATALATRDVPDLMACSLAAAAIISMHTKMWKHRQGRP
jgi:hypothetical protein